MFLCFLSYFYRCVRILSYLFFSTLPMLTFSSVRFNRSVMSDSLWPHEPQHARPHCPSPTPGVNPNPYPSSRWCHPSISSSVVPFSFCPQSFPASGSFPMSQLFTSGGQSIGASASASVFTMNIQGWFPLGLILEPKRIKFATVSIVSPSICHEVMGLDAIYDLGFLNVEF